MENHGGAGRVFPFVERPDGWGPGDEPELLNLRQGEDEPGGRQSALACGGCALSVVGALTATLIWSSSARTRRHLRGGFEGEGMDYTVLVTELPLVLAAGAAVPALACLLVGWVWGRRR
ncbi:hypothetical protein ACWD4G_34495 [Streptomyces sp. NPDC002643]